MVHDNIDESIRSLAEKFCEMEEDFMFPGQNWEDVAEDSGMDRETFSTREKVIRWIYDELQNQSIRQAMSDDVKSYAFDGDLDLPIEIKKDMEDIYPELAETNNENVIDEQGLDSFSKEAANSVEETNKNNQALENKGKDER